MAMDAKTRTVTRLVGVVVLMGGLAWASVPFYDWFCRVTGFGGTPGVATAGADNVLDQTIKIRFDASKERGMPWEFKPVAREMEIRIGETGLAFYEAYNPTDKPIAGQSSYNVTPYEAGGFFVKIDCFCFQEQVLQPGERVEMPVTFYVDPEIVTDRDAKYTHTITLSYTFYEIDLPQEQAALAQDAETDKNTN
ncbi:cytochrome c oxidase assembly protein [Roseovarius sp. CAU 1744]|uniref:cytochrome c oxidase assembly protein n=1 Tax=Roseovarius sp. CAU 1744 TaxID=3140368 RepID=UPI00325C040A